MKKFAFHFREVIERNRAYSSIYYGIIKGDKTEIYWHGVDGVSCFTEYETKKVKDFIEFGVWKVYEDEEIRKFLKIN